MNSKALHLGFFFFFPKSFFSRTKRALSALNNEGSRLPSAKPRLPLPPPERHKMAPRSPHLQSSSGAEQTREPRPAPLSPFPAHAHSAAALRPVGCFPALRSSDAPLLDYRERAGLYSPTQQLSFSRHLRAPRRERTRRYIASLPGGPAVTALANQRGGARELML